MHIEDCSWPLHTLTIALLLPDQ